MFYCRQFVCFTEISQASLNISACFIAAIENRYFIYSEIQLNEIRDINHINNIKSLIKEPEFNKLQDLTNVY